MSEAPPWATAPAGGPISARGLTSEEAASRLGRRPKPRGGGPRALRLLAAQFVQPLVAMLVVAAAISVGLGSLDDAVLLLAIVAVSGILGFVQEYQAEDVVARLQGLVRSRVTVRRDGRPVEVDVELVVPGDVVELSVGTRIPGDGRLIEADGLQVDESTLTGESFPADKGAVPSAEWRSAAVFLGTHVVSGTGALVVAATGADTELGRVSSRLAAARPPTDFAIKLNRFGLLLVQVTAAFVLGIFAVNVVLARPPLQSFLFSVALAVGLVPELLPAIVTVNLAAGARRMAAAGVIVKHLPSIETFGAVDLLCCDKTGTLTEGVLRLDAALDARGAPSERTARLAWLNARFESGYANPLDAAIRDAVRGEEDGWTRIGEVAYDFHRKRLSVVLGRDGARLVVTKGQLSAVLAVCTRVERPDGTSAPFDFAARRAVDALHARLAGEGRRLIGVAIRTLDPGEPVGRDVEAGLCLVGVLSFADPVKTDVPAVLSDLAHLGVSVRLVTGDDRRVAARVWRDVRGGDPVVLPGSELSGLTAEAFGRRVASADVLAEIEPQQKERIVLAYRRAGHVVAYLGDGINDAAALHAADVGISVDTAADVARDAADIVLRRPDLAALALGVREGRRTMARTLEYIRYTTSASFGNMLSMAVASLVLPFLPLLPKQVLLNNLLSDLPAMAIARDEVHDDVLRRPGQWRNAEIGRFMLLFGAISTAFDLATFGVLYLLTSQDERHFQAGWFVESLLTELFVLLVLRTPRPVTQDRPGRLLTGLVLAVAAVAFALPFTRVGAMFGLVPLPPAVVVAIVLLTAGYLAATEAAKRAFFARAAR